MGIWKLTSRTYGPIGLDIGNNYVKMIQLDISGGHRSVLAAGKVRLDVAADGDAEKRRAAVQTALAEILDKGKFEGRDVVSCLPNDNLRITSVRLAEMPEEQIEQELRKDVSQRFGLDAEKDPIFYVPAGAVKQGDQTRNEFIVFAADSAGIKSHVEILEEAQMRPVGIDPAPCAILRSFESMFRRQEDRERTVVFVDLGSRFTTVVFSRGGEISFVKQVATGGHKLDCRIAEKLAVTTEEARELRESLRNERSAARAVLACAAAEVPGGQGGGGTDKWEGRFDQATRQTLIDAISSVAEELAREISLCFRYYTVTFRGKRVEKAIFTGGEAYEKILINVLRRQLAVDVEIGQPLKGFDMVNVDFNSDRRGWLCEWAVAAGLGLKGLVPESRGSGNYEGN